MGGRVCQHPLIRSGEWDDGRERGGLRALAETTVFLAFFKDMPDRRQQGKSLYPLEEILLLSLLAMLAGAEAFADIALFGEKKL